MEMRNGATLNHSAGELLNLLHSVVTATTQSRKSWWSETANSDSDSEPQATVVAICQPAGRMTCRTTVC
jgi:hypothetical protein